MRENNYLKGKSKQMVTGSFSDYETSLEDVKSKLGKKKFAVACSMFLSMSLLVAFFVFHSNLKQIATVNKIQIQPMSPSIASTASKRTVLEIPVGTVKTNPFLPYRDIGDVGSYDNYGSDLISPPVQINENSEAARVMRTVISGILYDRYSPSAILNIEGSDYLVKKGDVVNNYQVLSITRDSVTVKLGENVYKAGIGELLTEGVINHNDVSNLNNKFGGENNGLQ